MNAYELADLITTPNSAHGAFCYEAATMLRQLQAENEALKAELSEWKSEPLVKLLKETDYVNVVAKRE